MNASETFCSDEFAIVHRLNVFYGVTKIIMLCWIGKKFQTRKSIQAEFSLVQVKKG